MEKNWGRKKNKIINFKLNHYWDKIFYRSDSENERRFSEIEKARHIRKILMRNSLVHFNGITKLFRPKTLLCWRFFNFRVAGYLEII